MSINNSERAVYPMVYTADQYKGAYYVTTGLTKLEHFAGLAMQGHLAGDLEFYGAKEVAENSVEYAKALLAELEKQQ
jgi:hypothetical protein